MRQAQKYLGTVLDGQEPLYRFNGRENWVLVPDNVSKCLIFECSSSLLALVGYLLGCVFLSNLTHNTIFDYVFLYGIIMITNSHFVKKKKR